jgi:microcystin-dependent protein
MALESGTYISDLVITNPDGTDTRSQGDDHIRLIKKTIKNSFPNINGPVTMTDEQLNSIAGVGIFCFPGMITMWSGSVGAIPAGWKLCNGVGTISTGGAVPNLVGRFIIGSATNGGGTYNVGATGGTKDSVVVSHSHVATSVVTDPGHTHTGATNAGGGTQYGHDFMDQDNVLAASTTGITVATTVASSGVSGVDKNLPPYYALAFLIKN